MVADQVWGVTLGGACRWVRAKSHQAAKRAAIDYWASCNEVPSNYLKSIKARIAEKWRGGIRARKIGK